VPFLEIYFLLRISGVGGIWGARGLDKVFLEESQAGGQGLTFEESVIGHGWSRALSRLLNASINCHIMKAWL
jgi:hypothetical protein